MVSYCISSWGYQGICDLPKGPLLLYGQGWIPDISYGDTVDITLPGMGQWIIKSLDASAKINLKSSLFSGVLVGEGVFLNLEQRRL